MVVTPGVASARSSPFSFTTMPIISGSSEASGREALSFTITSSLSAICFTSFGETKLTASICSNPASTSCFKYSALYSVGIKSGRPCHASRGHSISFIGWLIHRLSHFSSRIDDKIHHAINEQDQAQWQGNAVEKAVLWIAIGL